MRGNWLVLPILILVLLPAAAQAMRFRRVMIGEMKERPLPRYLCRRTTEKIVIDGQLREKAWQKAEAVAFTLYDGSAPPRWRTVLRACWDERNLYLAFVCSDDDIWASFSKRDSPLWEEKVVEAFLAPSSDLTPYYELEASPLNAVLDLSVYNPHFTVKQIQGDFSWTSPGWKTAVTVKGKVNDPKVRDEHWISEWAIPFADLAPGSKPARLPAGKPPRPGAVWRANFFRIDYRRDKTAEYSCWSPPLTSSPDFHVPPRFGYLEFAPQAR